MATRMKKACGSSIRVPWMCRKYRSYRVLQPEVAELEIARRIEGGT